MNIVITGTKELAFELSKALAKLNNHIRLVGRSNDHDINDVKNWVSEFKDYDWVINCAYDNFAQVTVLEEFAKMWDNNPNKKIINIGSIVTNYTRSEKEKDSEYFPYRLHKQALQLAFDKLVKEHKCDIKLINPGPFESIMTNHLTVPMFNKDEITKHIIEISATPYLKRVDLWK